MNKDREDKMGELKQQIEAGEYRVDPTAVADAIVRRLREPATGHSPAVRRSDRRRAPPWQRSERVLVPAELPGAVGEDDARRTVDDRADEGEVDATQVVVRGCDRRVRPHVGR